MHLCGISEISSTNPKKEKLNDSSAKSADRASKMIYSNQLWMEKMCKSKKNWNMYLPARHESVFEREKKLSTCLTREVFIKTARIDGRAFTKKRRTFRWRIVNEMNFQGSLSHAFFTPWELLNNSPGRSIMQTEWKKRHEVVALWRKSNRFFNQLKPLLLNEMFWMERQFCACLQIFSH